MGIKYKVNSDFFKAWSPRMGYVLGFVFADGSLEDASYLRGKYIRICSKDIEILRKIKKAMASKHKIVTVKPKDIFIRGKKYICKENYLLRIGDHELYKDLIGLGITLRKSKTIKFPSIPQEQLFHFVRGYLDGDGCVHYYKDKKRLSVIFTSGSKIFLDKLAQALSFSCGFKKHNIIYNNGAFQLRFSTKEAVKLLRRIYAIGQGDLLLSRKYSVYNRFIVDYPKWNSWSSN